MKDLINNNTCNFLSITIGVIGLILAIVFFIKSKKTKRPFYSKISINLLKRELKRIGNIEVKYLNQNVDDFTITKLAIWNGGHDTINISDVPENSSLRIEPQEEIIIYGAELLYQTDESNNFNIIHDKENNTVLIDFDYMDYNQGSIIKILHSGDSSANLNLAGKIKGVGNVKYIPDDRLDTTSMFFIGKLVFFLIGFLFIGLVVYAVIMKSAIGSVIYSALFVFLILIGGRDIFLSIKLPENIAKQYSD
jgi:hypothetical protein